ncbi:membrane protein [Streptomyces sp. NRRL S-495]|nr:membrane protein [Streptomyces sp. NRRL S-495]
MRAAGRAGFTARGVVYVVIGYLALRIATDGRGPDEADREGALRQIAARPGGTLLLWLLVLGFACMTLWRAAAAMSHDEHGGGRRKPGKRLPDAGRAVFYASVCWGTAAFASGTAGGSNSDRASKDRTADALALPGGRLLVGAAGLALVGVGVGIAVRAALRTFLRRLDTVSMGRRTRTAVTAIGVAGNAARGVVFAGVGLFAITAAARYDPGRARGVDDTLRSFTHTPAGPWLLAAVAVGLQLFGVFSFVSAHRRRF